VPKFLIVARYTADGMKGVVSKGGVARREAIAKMLRDAGGTLESFYFAFGEEDVYAVADLPDTATAAAVGMQVAASGMVTAKTVVLLTPEEVDAATRVGLIYRPPGS